MRRAILIIILFCSATAFSQNWNNADRIANGDLSWEECDTLIGQNRLADAAPSLLTLLRTCENNEKNYNSESLFFLFQLLYSYYMNEGDYNTTEQLINEVGHVLNSHETDPNNKYTRQLLTLRGKVSLCIRNYEEALQYFNMAQAYCEEKNDSSEEYAVALCDIALCYQGLGDLLSAKIYIDESIGIFERLYGSIYEVNRDELMPFIINYASINYEIGHENEAEKCYLAVIKNYSSTPYTHQIYQTACNNLSALYIGQGKWDMALNILEKLKKNNNDIGYNISQNLAICYLYLKKNRECISSLKDMNSVAVSNLSKLISRLSLLERENYITQITSELLTINNLIVSRMQDDEVTSTTYDNLLFCRNLQDNSYSLIHKLIQQLNDSRMSTKYKNYNLLREQLAYKSNMQGSQRDSLVRHITEQEKDILQNLPGLGERLKRMSKSWKEVMSSLEDDEIAIEYCYIPRMEYLKEVNPFYGAFLLRKSFKHPIFVQLANVDSVINLFRNNDPDQLFINHLYSSGNTAELYKLLWEKLCPYLKGIKKVYYSPTGLLSDINFDLLHGDDGIMLNDKYTLVRVSSTSNIATVKSTCLAKLKSAALFGNINYNENLTDMAESSSSYSSFTGLDISSNLQNRSENDRGNWGSIPYTKKEVMSIDSLLLNAKFNVSLYEGNVASEDALKALNGSSPDILHVSTHGFVINTPNRAEGNKFIKSTFGYSRKEAYMLWSGLVFAGGNNVWRGDFNLKSVEDGILTADEISRLDLSNTKLVVLSACETARGVVDPIDGIYGLQRAFKMAGVKTIVMSLWKVNDVTTAMLMTHFYKYLVGGYERHQALWKAMMNVRKDYPDPYYWAGFVMLD